MRIGDTLEVITFYPVDRDEVGAVGEVLCSGRGYVCEVTIGRDGKATLELYSCDDADFWTLDYEEFLTALKEARGRATPPLDPQDLPGS